MGVGAGAGPSQIIFVKQGVTSYTADPNPAGATLLVYSLAPSGSPAFAQLTGGGKVTSADGVNPVEVTLDGTPGTLVVSGHFLADVTITIPGAPKKTNPNVNDICVTHPEVCVTKSHPPVCGPGQVLDSVTGACSTPCVDGSAPQNSKCGSGTGPTAGGTGPSASAPAATNTTAYVVGGLGILVAGAAAWYALK